ncbi:MAG: hypothetical protein MK134_10560 [Dehalococcoidia bacterium]|nr:hypothetical protein [Candidatus Poseidoniales archaeon]MCH2515972.1 hypothetical protein [Dehalococcoidia bacterium]
MTTKRAVLRNLGPRWAIGDIAAAWLAGAAIAGRATISTSVVHGVNNGFRRRRVSADLSGLVVH